MPVLLAAQLLNLLVIPLNAITQRRRYTHQRQQRFADLDGNCLLYLLCEARARTLGKPRAHTLTSPRVALISSVRAATNASRARNTTRSCRTSRLRCCIGCNDSGSTRPNRANLLASIRSLFRLRRFDPSIKRGLATNTSCPQPPITSCTHGECVPTSKTTRAAFNA